MSVYITSLNSGSNGNCYYIGNDEEAVLIDAGLSCRETERRMERLGLTLDKVKAVFISHEHTDHIRGLAVLSKKYQLPVYITRATLSGSRLSLPPHLVYEYHESGNHTIGNFTVIPFRKFHDAADPHSFMVTYSGIKIGIFTDIGIVCDQLKHYFSQCHAAFLEANYDEVLLENGGYPYHLKNRIRGGKGHLSNKQALALFMEHRPAYMSHLLLSHLSRDNNDPVLVEQLFSGNAGKTQVIIASRYAETPVFRIGQAIPVPITKEKFAPKQLSLF